MVNAGMSENVDDHDNSNYSRRVVSAGLWSVGMRLMEKSLSFARTVILARILAPSDFGLFGIAVVALSALEAFSQTGFQVALIQKRHDVDASLDAAWTVQVVRGMVLLISMYFAAPWIAEFLGDSRATPLLQVLGLSSFVRSMENIGVVKLQRELRFDRLFGYSAAGLIIDLAVSVGMALAVGSAWALIGGMIAGNVGRLFASYIVQHRRPRFEFDISRVRELSRYGFWIYFNNMLTFLVLRGDNAVVAKLLGPLALGVYEMSCRLSDLLTREFATVLGNFSLPAYARIQNERLRLQRIYCQSLEVVAAVAFPAAAATMVLARPITEAILGPQWTEVALVLPFLAFAGSLRSIASVAGAAYNGVGRPDASFNMNLLRTITAMVLIIPFTLRYGIEGTGASMAGGAIMLIPALTIYSRKVLGVSGFRMLRAMVPAFLLTSVVWVVGSSGAAFSVQMGTSGLLLILAVTGLSYGVIAALIWWRFRAGPGWVVERLFTSLGARGLRAAVETP